MFYIGMNISVVSSDQESKNRSLDYSIVCNYVITLAWAWHLSYCRSGRYGKFRRFCVVNRYLTDKNASTPPLHHNCQSLLIPLAAIVLPWYCRSTKEEGLQVGCERYTASFLITYSYIIIFFSPANGSVLPWSNWNLDFWWLYPYVTCGISMTT